MKNPLEMISKIYRMLTARLAVPSRPLPVSRFAIDQWENEGGAIEPEGPRGRSDGWGSESAMTKLASFEE